MPPKIDFVSAAIRHARDARTLLDEGSRDQAWHLGGFAHECSRKAYLESGWIAKVLGHDFAEAGEVVLELALALEPRAGRFRLRGWISRYPAIGSWRPDHRYERTGSSDSRPAEALVESARTAVDECLASLLLESRLDVGSLR